MFLARTDRIFTVFASFLVTLSDAREVLEAAVLSSTGKIMLKGCAAAVDLEFILLELFMPLLRLLDAWAYIGGLYALAINCSLVPLTCVR